MREDIKIKRILQKAKYSVFIKIFSVFSLGIGLPVLLIGMLTIDQSTSHSLQQISQSNKKVLREKKMQYEQKINEIEQSAFRFIGQDAIWQLMDSNELTVKHSFLMANLASMFTATLSTNHEMESIYFFDNIHPYVIAETKYTKEDFKDQEALTLAQNMNPSFKMIHRKLQDQDVITFIKSFSLPSSSSIGLLVFNVNYKLFFDELAMYEIMLTDRAGRLIYVSEALANQLPQTYALGEILLSGKLDADEGVLDLDNTPFYMTQETSDKMDINFHFVQPYDQLVQPALLLRKTIIASMSIVFGLSLLLAFMFSGILYRPLSRLAISTRKYLGQGAAPQYKNEYQMIETAIAHMHEENSQITDKYKVAFPFLQKYSLHDLLSKGSLNREQFTAICRTLNFDLSSNSFAMAAIDFENIQINDTVREKLSDYFTERKGYMHCLRFELGDKRTMLLFNTDLPVEALHSELCELKTSLNNEGFELTLALSQPFSEIADIPASYRHALRLLDHKFFIGKNEIIYNMPLTQDKQDLFVDNKQIEKLLQRIQERNFKEAARAFDHITQSMIGQMEHIDYIRYIHFQICSQIISVLMEFRVDLKSSSLSKERIFQSIQRSETIEELDGFVKTLMEESTVLLDNANTQHHSDLIEQTKAFIRAHYCKDISLEDISRVVFLSPRYLGTIFKAQTGATIFEYVTQLRMQRAMELLVSTDMKIQDISNSTGYNTVQSFIRFFKKHFHMTPNDFRKKTYIASQKEEIPE
ncbi:AraC family transcriptional regulator [Paenibacillus sp. IB182496]|uniref:AraC family transcriptional regulator n=1 Tax=Paenibacillus sabuli TaxID=2772509 RepID=A0A927GQM0_9BACL|nr:helix-turn-helix domain-containing protein [Paenibacillus sabuli]MBD2844035.1 AraC family transcriptional regulator [Paenibacillus sabuli]